MVSKAPANRQLTPLAALSLKAVGMIIILAAMIDIFVLPIPYQLLERQWQVAFVTQSVDRGVVPMVGLALLFTGFWVSSLINPPEPRKAVADLKFWILILSSLLGLFYLLALPLHLNNLRVVSNQALEQIQQEATQAETQLDTQLNQEVGQQREQITQLLGNEELFEQALQSGQVTQDQAQLLEQFRQDPAALDEFISQRVEELQTQYQTEIGMRREGAIRQARLEAIKSSIRIGIGSFLLAVGYILIGWTGLRLMGQSPTV